MSHLPAIIIESGKNTNPFAAFGGHININAAIKERTAFIMKKKFVLGCTLCAMLISMFGATLTFAAEKHPPEVAENFIPHDITILEHPSQNEALKYLYQLQEIPTAAMSMEEAAQIGAQYIWDMFGENIDGMYVSMRFSAQPHSSRMQWIGRVSRTPEAFQRAPEASLTNENFDPLYSFAIDAVTGERLDISYWVWRVLSKEESQAQELTRGMFGMEWHNMSTPERIEFIGGIPQETLDAYMQTAKEFAQRHFNNTTVIDIQLGGNRLDDQRDIEVHGRIDENGEFTFVLSTLTFLVTDDTSREAFVRISAESALWNMIFIDTRHNDIAVVEEFR